MDSQINMGDLVHCSGPTSFIPIADEESRAVDEGLGTSVWEGTRFWILEEDVTIQVLCIRFRIADRDRTLEPMISVLPLGFLGCLDP